ncbi:nascent polypeptide-associated complex protein [Haladaptatus sp. DYSN1]|uniref:nascent polypeptide-associated complex protein n=1 Tax=unclassified Haladaptatus TaxID=2622732 RepID=UPI00240564C4|nr:nascent polypeptide-associated complex protein [Haladaptatus sp. DYSN1]
MFGGGGLNPRKMKQMMKQMGIEVEDIDAEEVIIRTKDEDLVFTDAEVQRMDAQGQQTYQIVGEPESRPRGAGDSPPAVEGDAAGEPEEDASTEVDIPDSDVEIVAQRTGASATEAREALEAENGDLAAAISRLE